MAHGTPEARARTAAAPIFSGIGPGHYLFKPRPQALHGGTPAGAGLFRRHVPDSAPFGAPPGATQDSIANHLFIDKCNVARRTKKLETLGYLYRETNQNDRRENHLYLTDKGRELVPTIREYLGQWGRSITADLTDTECAELLALLTKMTGQDRK